MACDARWRGGQIVSRRRGPRIQVVSMEYQGQRFSDPFFENIARYPVPFAHPVILGESPNDSETAALASGTGVLLRLSSTFVIGVTCHHVLKAFRQKREVNPQSVFSFGGRMIPV